MIILLFFKSARAYVTRARIQHGMDVEVPVGIYDGKCKIDFGEIVSSVANI